MFNPKKPLKLRVQRLNWQRDIWVYLQSPFHTLLNMPSHRFFLLFVTAYLAAYSFFGLFYLLTSDQCVEGIHKFSHAFFFSVQTAATIGYGGDLSPNPDCVTLNMFITIHTIVSLMLDYSMLGLVYARFSSPTLRASSIRFSKSLFMHMREEALVLSCRVTNVRSKNIINPSVRLLLAMEDPAGESSSNLVGNPLHLMALKAALSNEDEACLSLGLPAQISHVIDDDSPLLSLSLERMAQRKMEILVLVNGTDAMTSHHIQARHSYQAADIVLYGDRADHILRRLPDGCLTVDFACFTQQARGPQTLDDAVECMDRHGGSGRLNGPGDPPRRQWSDADAAELSQLDDTVPAQRRSSTGTPEAATDRHYSTNSFAEIKQTLVSRGTGGGSLYQGRSWQTSGGRRASGEGSRPCALAGGAPNGDSGGHRSCPEAPSMPAIPERTVELRQTARVLQLRSEMLGLCAAVITDPGAGGDAKERAMLLRAELRESDRLA